ncbi:MAG: hypothetical protein K1W26_17410 [Acetatifactor sp.]
MAGETQPSRNAEGFIFLNAEDAGMASKERKQIEYLEKHLDYRHPQQVLTLYERMLRERIFKTPVGMIYLKHLQDFLLDQENIDPAKVPMIPINAPCITIPKKRERPVRSGVGGGEEERGRKAWLRTSVILNVLLALAVVLMFALALTSNQPNIVNYRTAILNEYASWEQDLQQREQIIRDKERELKIIE